MQMPRQSFIKIIFRFNKNKHFCKRTKVFQYMIIFR